MHPSGAAGSLPAAQQQPTVQCGRPPRAAKSRAPAVWLQAEFDNSGGESSSNPRKAQPSAALARLQPKGAVQQAAANASTVRAACIVLPVPLDANMTTKLAVIYYTMEMCMCGAGCLACCCKPHVHVLDVSGHQVTVCLLPFFYNACRMQLAGERAGESAAEAGEGRGGWQGVSAAGTS